MAERYSRNGTNRLLTAVDKKTQQDLAPYLEPVSLALRQKLYEPNQPINSVYFPVNGVVSLLAHMEEGMLIEVATIGNEGIVGLPVFLGAELTPGISFSQIPGEALRMAAKEFRKFLATSESLTQILHRYTQALMVQISQGNACNRIHSIEQRCARWLLLCHDRIGGDEFVLTQEFLSQMLGVRRASVNHVAGTFQQAGLVEYSRGMVRILNRKDLESASCRCYAVIRDEYDRMFKPNRR
jgi:CRP-like cAMP-binding protein